MPEHMKREVLSFNEGDVEVRIFDNIIYLKTLRTYTDAIARGMMQYLEKIINALPYPTIRIWDTRYLPPGAFKLTRQCVHEAVMWSDKIKREKPGTKAYFIAPEPLIFGTTRMYATQADDKSMEYAIVRNIDELPDEIQEKISWQL